MGSKELMDMLKQAEDAQKMKADHLDMEDADNNIPREAPLQYEFMCRIVGSLYIQHHHGMEVMKERYGATISGLQEQLRDLMSDNKRLKEELSNAAGSHQVPPQ